MVSPDTPLEASDRSRISRRRIHTVGGNGPVLPRNHRKGPGREGHPTLDNFQAAATVSISSRKVIFFDSSQLHGSCWARCGNTAHRIVHGSGCVSSRQVGLGFGVGPKPAAVTKPAVLLSGHRLSEKGARLEIVLYIAAARTSGTGDRLLLLASGVSGLFRRETGQP
ncbi:hypothetical protein CALCODRAFT_81301 [Calocera cornea HHB12733]|uniref:Uncharacterized protein n=1 Tax=Calocera cornea HHB12733 TaxID=1353952 RepID=A0A165DEL3_9BASI|nr:hypothetical protein CALCODRAFT_81301 [Calocera cornea HHB12733]